MIAIISDIHGNYPALKAVLSKIDDLKCDNVICLGDVAGYYAMINQCIEELRIRNITTLLGNHDNYLANDIECTRSTTANNCLRYQKGVITEENIKWLRTLKPKLETSENYYVHAGWNDNIDEYLYNISDDYFDKFEHNYFFSGHTHIPKIQKFPSGKIYANPGSVGQPRDGDARASFLLIENKEFTIMRVEYDVNQIALYMDQLGFEERVYKNLYYGKKIGEV